MKGCAGDAAWLSSHHMSNPSPSPSHDDDPHAVLVSAGEKMLVADGLRPEYSQDSFKVLGVEAGQFFKLAFSTLSSSILSRTVGWKVSRFGAALAWSWCCTRIKTVDEYS